MPEEVPVCVALLHDVVEDTDVTLEQLEQEFPKEITELVAKNPIATQVKATNIYHNKMESRLSGVDSVSKEQKIWWEQKYEKALEILLSPEKDEMEQKTYKPLTPLADQQTYERMEKLRKKILPYSRSVMTEHRFEVFAAIERVLQLADKASDVGMCGLEAERKELLESETELEQFLALGLDIDAIAENRSIYNMLDSFEESKGNLANDFIRYIYMGGVMLMLSGENSQKTKAVCLSLLPDEKKAEWRAIRGRKG